MNAVVEKDTVMQPVRITIYDVLAKEWRAFDVVPSDGTFIPSCSQTLHQFRPGAVRCCCGVIPRR